MSAPSPGGSPGILYKSVGPPAYGLRNRVWRVGEVERVLYLSWVDWVFLSWSLTLVTVLATVCARFW